MSKCTRSFLVFGLAVFVAGLFLPASALAQNDAVVSQTIRTTAIENDMFWTPERLAAAKPMPMPVLDASRRVPGGVAAPAGGAVPAVRAGSGEPGAATLLEEVQLSVAEQGPAPQFAPGTFAYTRYRLFPDLSNVAKKFPYSTVGKLYFQIPGRAGSCARARLSTRPTARW